MHLDEDKDQWWALVNTVMNLLFSQKERDFLTVAERLLVSEDGLFTMG
jgi:hypothetical protein